MNKEYRFTVIVSNTIGIFIVDYGKFRGPYQVFKPVLENLNQKDLFDLAKVYQLKSGSMIAREIDKFSNVGKTHCEIANDLVCRHIDDNENLFNKKFYTAFNEHYMDNEEKPYMRVGMTLSISNKMTGGDITTFVTKDKEPVSISALFQGVYDSKKRKARGSNSI
ncbi:MAG: hypothetical protein ACRCX8_00660 [Sarcina sp.]